MVSQQWGRSSFACGLMIWFAVMLTYVVGRKFSEECPMNSDGRGDALQTAGDVSSASLLTLRSMSKASIWHDSVNNATDGNSPGDGWCLPNEKCQEDECCASGTSCNTCPVKGDATMPGKHIFDKRCAGKGEFRCCKAGEDCPACNSPPTAHCLPHQSCQADGCCAEGSSCNRCPGGPGSPRFRTDSVICAGKGNMRCYGTCPSGPRPAPPPGTATPAPPAPPQPNPTPSQTPVPVPPGNPTLQPTTAPGTPHTLRPTPVPSGPSCEIDTGAACDLMGVCFQRARGSSECRTNRNGTKSCHCTGANECVVRRKMPVTKEGEWRVCRKSEEDYRGESNPVSWFFVVSLDILSSFANLMTGGSSR